MPRIWLAEIIKNRLKSKVESRGEESGSDYWGYPMYAEELVHCHGYGESVSYLSRDVHENINKQMGIQAAPICPGIRRTSGLYEAPNLAAEGS